MAVYGIGGGGLSVGVTMFLRDQFSGPARRINTNAKNMRKEMELQSRATTRSARDAAAGYATMGAIGLGAMYQWTKVGAEFDYTMTFVGLLADKTGGHFEQLKDMAKKSAVETIYSTREIADGMRYMAMAGQDAGEILANTGPFSKLAQATMWQFGGKGGTADIATNVMRAFNLEASRASEVADQLSVATTSSNVNMGDMGASIKYVAASASMLGYKLPEIAAAIGVMGDSGIQGSMAGTSLQNMLQYLSKSVGKFSTKRQKTALSMMGLDPSSFVDAKGNLKDINSIMLQFKQQTSGLGSSDRLNVMTALFGKRGVRAADALIQNLDRYNSKLNAIENSTGDVDRKSAAFLGTLQGHMLILANEAENFRIAFTEAVTPALKDILSVLTKVVKGFAWFANSDIGAFLIRFGAGWLAIKTTLWAVTAAVKTLALVSGKGTLAMVIGTSRLTRGWRNAKTELLEYRLALRGMTGSSAFVGGLGSIVAGKNGSKMKVNPQGGYTRVKNSAKTGKIMGPMMLTSQLTKPITKGVLKGGAKLGLKALGRTALGFVPVIGQIAMFSWLAYDVYQAIAGNTKETAENTAEQKRSMEEIRKKLVDEKMIQLYSLDRAAMERRVESNSKRYGNSWTMDPTNAPAPRPINIHLIQDGEEKLNKMIKEQNIKDAYYKIN